MIQINGNSLDFYRPAFCAVFPNAAADPLDRRQMPSQLALPSSIATRSR
jgi:hypothetical protein